MTHKYITATILYAEGQRKIPAAMYNTNIHSVNAKWIKNLKTKFSNIKFTLRSAWHSPKIFFNIQGELWVYVIYCIQCFPLVLNQI